MCGLIVILNHFLRKYFEPVIAYELRGLGYGSNTAGYFMFFLGAGFIITTLLFYEKFLAYSKHYTYMIVAGGLIMTLGYMFVG